jgi:hypothetical protein
MFSLGPSGPTALTIPESFGTSSCVLSSLGDAASGTFADQEPPPLDLPISENSVFGYVAQGFANGDALPLPNSDLYAEFD